MCTHVLLAGVCFGNIIKPPLNEYDVCAAMNSCYLAVSRIVAVSLSLANWGQTVVIMLILLKYNFLKVPIISDFNVKAQVPCKTCCREMQV